MGYLTERLLHTEHEEGCCCGECGCENEHDREEIVEKSLSESEIEEIINERYSEKDEKTKKFIRRALGKFGDRFDYSKTQYKTALEKVIITCPKHNLDFEQIANEHYRPLRHNVCNPCPKCASEERTRVMFRRNREENIQRSKRTFEEFILQAKEIVGDELDLSLVTEYKTAVTPVPVICKTCGHPFNVPPNTILRGGASCPKCSREKLSEKRRMGFLGFKKRAEQVHPNNRYFYDFKENYDLKRNSQKVKIKCNKCGNIFWQEVASHLSGRGCPRCVLSRGEEIVDAYLKEREIIILGRENIIGVSSVREYVVPDFRFILDSKEVWIEYNGIQHYKATFNFGDKLHARQVFSSQYHRDNDVRNYCKDKGITLIEIPYILKKKEQVYDFLDKVLFNNIDPNTLIDYSSLYVLEDLVDIDNSA